jgi:hypothetical protein
MTHDELREVVKSALWANCDDFGKAADAALSVVREALREVSHEMCAAYERHGGDYSNAEGDWRAMLAASPLADPRA